MKFSYQSYEKFINLVRERPALYNYNLAAYKDHQLQKNHWKSIAEAMGHPDMTGQDWKKIWKQKRDGFIKKRREIVSGQNGSTAKNVYKGPLYDQMLFLCDFTTSLSNCSDQNQDFTFGIEINDAASQEGTESLPDLTASPLPSPAMPHETLKNENEKEIHSMVDQDMSENGLDEPTKCTKKYARKRKGTATRESVTTVEKIMDQSCGRSSENFDQIQNMLGRIQDDESNLYYFLSKKAKELKKETQEWMEDEVMKVYMEARRRDQSRMEVQNTDKEFRIRLDLSNYSPDEVKVTSSSSKISIHAKHTERQDSHSFVSREMKRTYQLPNDVDPNSAASTMNSNGTLSIKIAKRALETQKETAIHVEFKKS